MVIISHQDERFFEEFLRSFLQPTSIRRTSSHLSTSLSTKDRRTEEQGTQNGLRKRYSDRDDE